MKEKKCTRCGKEAVTFIRYSGAHLCGEHFLEFVRRKVSRELRKQVDLPAGARIAVAVSGGKDSIVALRLLHELLSPRRGTEIMAITIDEGIRGYRPPALKVVADNCRELGVKHYEISFKETFGLTMDSTKGRWGESTPCTYCGVLRRHCMNRKARELNADFLATGLNLDDTAQSILMNICRGDVERLARLGPHKLRRDANGSSVGMNGWGEVWDDATRFSGWKSHDRVQGGLVPRIQPLREVTDKESFLFAVLTGYTVHHSVCPYAGEAMRNRFRDTVLELERASPGTRFCILNTYDALRPAIEAQFPQASLRPCRKCGEPSVGERCETCKLVEALSSGKAVERKARKNK